jgi:ectoine hydroxylase-related dioxygenase (phytanoyl-CoA dioxygenase family)
MKKNYYLIKKLKEDGFVYLSNNKVISFIREIRKIVKKNFSLKTKDYLEMNTDKFHKIILKTLNNINKNINLKKMQTIIADQFSNQLNINEEFMVSSFITLFVTRPHSSNQVKKSTEYVSFHRENFYGRQNYLNYQYNFWFPVFDIMHEQNFKYVPKSHLIPDKNIKVKKLRKFPIKKNSAAHKSGMNYAPKIILKGVDLKKSKRFKVPKSNYLILNANLIHGGGMNLSNKLRYSIAFGLIPKKYINKKTMPINFRKNKPHYIDL